MVDGRTVLPIVYAHYIASMRRRRLFRLIGLPLSLWFVALATDIGGIDACPMHDAMAHGMSVQAMAQMGMPHAPAASGSDRAPTHAPQGPMQCTCMGLCCGCAMATLPTAPVTPVAAVAAVQHAVPTGPTARAAASAPRYLLPPAIGPPALHTI
jgi:hypothetical protein